MRDRMNVYLPADLMKGISELAERKKLSRSAIVEAAVASFLLPDGADKREAAFARFWLTITPPLPADAQSAAQIKGRERYEGFVETLGRRLQKGQSFLREIPDDIAENSQVAAFDEERTNQNS